MLFWEKTLLEIPHVEDVAIEDQSAWLDALQVIAQLAGVTAVTAKMRASEITTMSSSRFIYTVMKVILMI